MNSEFSNWYRAKFNQLDDNPPKEIWENISNELDIEEVWTNVDSELQKHSRNKALLRKIFYSVILLLLIESGYLYFYYHPLLTNTSSIAQNPRNHSGNNIINEEKYFSPLKGNNNPPITAHKNIVASQLEVSINDKKTAVQKNTEPLQLEVINENKKTAVQKTIVASQSEGSNNDKNIAVHKNTVASQLEVNNDDNEIAIRKNNITENYPSKKIILSPQNTVNGVSKSLKEKRNKNIKPLLAETNSNLAGSKMITTRINGENKHNIFDSIINPNNTSTALFAMLPIQVHIPEKIDSAVSSLGLIYFPNEVHSKRLIIGAAFAYSNSWLLNSDTYDGFNKNSLNQTNLSFGNSYALTLGYDLSDKYTVQTEWAINNKQEQGYVRYRAGRQVQKKIEINYTHFNLLVKKKEITSAFKNRIPASLNYLAGIQYDYIKSVSRTINGETRSVKNRYRNDNYSLVLGMEYQLIIKHLWVISSGIRADIGLRNIYVGSAVIPASFNPTYNSSIELNFGINYIIPIKTKK